MDEIIGEDVQKIVKELEPFREKITGKTFLVTGGAGFLGSWFCDVLDAFGANVICVDNLISGSSKNISHLLQKKNFKFVKHDVTKKIELDGMVDYIVHMASIASTPLYQKYPIETLDANIFGTLNMLELAKQKKVKGFLLTSTSEIYGNPPDNMIPTPETFPGHVASMGPRSMYDEGKRAAEAYAYNYFKQFGLPIRVARIFNVYGPRLDVESTSQYGRAIVKFLAQSIKNETVTVYGDGKQTRSFCYVSDEIEGLFKLLLTPDIDGEVFNIGNKDEISILDLANLIVKITNSKSEIVINSPPNFNLKDDPRRRCPDTTKARKLLNFSPKTNLEFGIDRLAKWMKKM